jgi:hypothetical protein
MQEQTIMQSLLLESVLLCWPFTIFWVSLPLFMYRYCIDSISVVIRQTILQLKTPDHMRQGFSCKLDV